MKNSNLVPMTLIIAVLISAVIVVQLKHRNQTLTSELDQLRHEQQRLDLEWSQLQLEQATLAQHGRVDQLARSQFGMVEPAQPVIVDAVSGTVAGNAASPGAAK